MQGLIRWVTGLLLIAGSAGAQLPGSDPFAAEREAMIKTAIIDSGVRDRRVIQAIRTTPREEFVPYNVRKDAYKDMALPIGEQQTISSPFIVAYMTECLDPHPTDRVLEIGTGSGYQAAVLSPLVKDVYSIEIVESLGLRAARTLERLGYKNVHTKIGDGFAGWAENAPFDKIIVTCSPEQVPQPLVEQLREGGLMVIPVGERYQQSLVLLRKTDGKLVTESLRPTLFVPMTGTAESRREHQPDGTRPELGNPSFEEPPNEHGFVPAWYYQRLQTWVEDDSAPDGKHYVRLENDLPGRSGHLLQGFSVDGQSVHRLKVSAWIKLENVREGRNRYEVPVIAVTFYDADRRDLGMQYIGPYQGTTDWEQKQETFRVPATATEGLIRIGLFGATGRMLVDHVTLEAHK